MGKVKVTFDGDELKLFRKFEKLQRAQDKLMAKARETGDVSKRATDKASTGHDNLAGAQGKVLKSIGQIAAGFGLAGGIQAGISKIVSLVDEWKQGMDRLAKASAEAGRDITALAMMQRKGEAGEVARRAVATGARYGMGAGASWAAMQQLQAQTGTVAGGLAALEATGRLSQWAGVEQGAAAQAVSLTMGLGMGAGEGARGIYAAGELSSLSPEEMARMAPKGMPGWKDPTMGLAVAAQLSQVYKEPGRLGTFTAKARKGIMGPRAVTRLDEQGKKEKVDFWQEQMGLSGDAGFFERLRALRGRGLTTENALERAGFGEERERTAIALLLQPGKIEELERKQAAISGMVAMPGLLAGKRAAAEAEIPQMGYQRVAEIATALEDIERKYPSTPAGRAAQRQGEERDILFAGRRIAARRAGFGAWVGDDEQIGAVKWGVMEDISIGETVPFTERGYITQKMARLFESMGLQKLRAGYGQSALDVEFGKVSQELREAANALKDASRGGPAQAGPDEDR